MENNYIQLTFFSYMLCHHNLMLCPYGTPCRWLDSCNLSFYTFSDSFAVCANASVILDWHVNLPLNLGPTETRIYMYQMNQGQINTYKSVSLQLKCIEREMRIELHWCLIEEFSLVFSCQDSRLPFNTMNWYLPIYWSLYLVIQFLVTERKITSVIVWLHKMKKISSIN